MFKSARLLFGGEKETYAGGDRPILQVNFWVQNPRAQTRGKVGLDCRKTCESPYHSKNLAG